MASKKPKYYLINDGKTDIEAEKKKYLRCGFHVVVIKEGTKDGFITEWIQSVINNHSNVEPS